MESNIKLNSERECYDNTFHNMARYAKIVFVNDENSSVELMTREDYINFVDVTKDLFGGDDGL